MESITRVAVEQAVRAHLPGRAIESILDRGEWMRRIWRITLDRGEVVYLKASIHSGEGWLDGSQQEANAARMFAEHGLPAPRVLAVDRSRTIIPYPYVIETALERGVRLGELLTRVDTAEIPAIYAALGQTYRRMHAVHGPRSGVWKDTPDETLPVSPNDYMYQAEIVGGCGRRALDEGRISQRTYDRVVRLWAKRMGYLKEHQPTLLHGSPFLWTIYLECDREGWRVTRLMSLGDVLWWDPAYDLAFLRYPPFGQMEPAWWEAFSAAYGPLPEHKRILLYALLQRLCAAMSTYAAPQSLDSLEWAARCLDDLGPFMDEIEGTVEGSGQV